MKVDVEDVLKAKKFLKSVNREKLSDIQFYHGNKKLLIEDEQIERFTFVGLNNTDFIDFLFENQLIKTVGE